MNNVQEPESQVEALRIELEQAYRRIRDLHVELRDAKSVRVVPEFVEITNFGKKGFK